VERMLPKALVGASLLLGVVAGSLSMSASASARPSPAPPVSGATATITVPDGLTPSGVSVKPFPVQMTVAGISFPTREGGNQALPGNVFVHVTLRVKNLASASRVVPFNGSSTRTMAMGVSHAVPGDGVNDSVCSPPALDGLAVDPQVSAQVTAQWCVVAASYETVTLRAHKTGTVTFSGEVVSTSDAKPENFSLIYSPTDAAQPTIFPVGPGQTATTSPT
jgi:hypothetical protein